MSKTFKAYLPSLALAAVIGAGAVIALAPPSSAPAVAAAAAPAWAVDKAASSLMFDALEADTGQPFMGLFQKWDAKIAFDPANLAGSSVSVTVDVSAMKSDFDDATESFPWPEWMNAASFPNATFTSASFKDLGGGKYEADGVLKIKGVEKPVVLPFTLAITGDTAKMNGAVDLDRTAFAVGTGKWAGDDFIGKKVTVKVAVTAKRAA